MKLSSEDERRLVKLALLVGQANRECTCGACYHLQGLAPAIFTLLPPESENPNQ